MSVSQALFQATNRHVGERRDPPKRKRNTFFFFLIRSFSKKIDNPQVEVENLGFYYFKVLLQKYTLRFYATPLPNTARGFREFWETKCHAHLSHYVPSNVTVTQSFLILVRLVETRESTVTVHKLRRNLATYRKLLTRAGLDAHFTFLIYVGVSVGVNSRNIVQNTSA